MDPKNKTKENIKQKSYFDVKMEVTLPAVVVYRVLAEDAEKALEEISATLAPSNVKYELTKKKIKKATVYDAGCSVIKHIKNWR